jgi:hypothetical protein
MQFHSFIMELAFEKWMFVVSPSGLNYQLNSLILIEKVLLLTNKET